MRKSGVGDSPGRSGFPSQMYGLRAPDYGAKKIGRKKYKTNYKKGLKQQILYGTIVCTDEIDTFRCLEIAPKDEPGLWRSTKCFS